MDAVALYDFEAEQSDELSFKQGDAVRLLNQVNDVWWFGRLIANGRTGIFPGSYVQTATAAPATAAAAAAAAEPPPVQTAAAAVPTVPVVAATPDNKRLSTSFVNHPVTRFLTSMDLDEYVTSFLEKGFDDMDILEELTEADLDVIGVVPLEHRRRIMNAVSASRLRSVSEPVERVRSPSSAVDNTPVPSPPVGLPAKVVASTPSTASSSSSSSPAVVAASPPVTDLSVLSTSLPSLSSSGVLVSAPVVASQKDKLAAERKTGWLYKQGQANKGWKKRWIVLANGEVRYYKSEKDKEAAGSLLITEMLKVAHSPIESRKDPKYPHCFQVATSRNRVFMFCGETEKEMNSWMEAFDGLIQIKEKLAGVPMYGQENSNGSSSTSPVLPAPSRSTSSGPIAISAFSRALSVRLPNVVLPRKNSEKSSSLGDESYSKTNSSLSSLTSLSSPVTSSTSPSVAATLLDEEGQSPPEKEGWLKKQGNNVQKDWKRRYIVIRSNRLYYYRSYDDFLASSPINFVELMTSAVKPAIAANKFRFELVTVNRSFWFQAENAHELNDWLNSLRTAIGQALSSGTSAAESTQAPASPEHAIASAANKSAMEHLRQNPGNRVCADCGAADPEWSSCNLGILVCIECSGLHRSLGVQISKVKSLTLDDWSESSLKFMEAIGNDVSNSIWEASPIPSVPKPSPNSPREQKRNYITAKYVDCKFVVDGDVDAKTLLAAIESNDVKTLLAVTALRWPASVALNQTNETLENGATVVMHAALAGSLECLEFLLQNGEELLAKNNDGLTVSQLVQEGGKEAIVNCIQSHTVRQRKDKVTTDSIASSESDSHMDYRCGNLFKRGEINTFYKRRWMVFENNTLRYYKEKDDREPAGTIVVPDMISVTIKDDHEKPFAFELLTRKGRVYKMAADNEIQLVDWTDVLRLAIDRRQASYEFSHPALDLSRYGAHGSMAVQEHGETQWRKRWSLLKEKSIYHFADEKRELLMSSLDLRQLIEVVRDTPPPGHSGDKPYYVALLKMQGRQYRFMFDSEVALTSWLTAIMETQVFGQPLHIVAQRQSSSMDKNVPLVLVKCISYLNTYGLEQEGLYRLPGDANQVAKLKLRFNQDERIVNLSSEHEQVSVHTISVLIKMYLRELPEPLLTTKLQGKFVDATGHGESAVDAVRALILDLPEANRNTLRKVVNHFCRLLELSELNHMTMEPLSAIVSSCLLRDVDGEPHLGKQASEALVTLLFSKYSELFEESSLLVTSNNASFISVTTTASAPTMSLAPAGLGALGIRRNKTISEVPQMCDVFLDDGASYTGDNLRTYLTPVTNRMTAKEVVIHVSKRVQEDNPTNKCVDYALFEVVAGSERVVDGFEKVANIVNTWKPNSHSSLVIKHNPLRQVLVLMDDQGFPDVRGWLFKAAQNARNWQKRYCILRPEGIFYFSDDKSLSDPRGIIPILGLISLSLATTTAAQKKMPTRFCFSINRRNPKTPSDDFCRLFAAESEEQKLWWLAAIRLAKKPRVSTATLFSWPPKGFEVSRGPSAESVRSDDGGLKDDSKGDDEDEDEDEDDEDALERAEEEAEKARALHRHQQVQRLSALRQKRQSINPPAALSASGPTSAPPTNRPWMRWSRLPPPPKAPVVIDAPVSTFSSGSALFITTSSSSSSSSTPIGPAATPPSPTSTAAPQPQASLWDELEDAEREIYEIEQELDHLADVQGDAAV